MQEQKEGLDSFLTENSKLAREYFETQVEIYRLKSVRLISKSAGYFLWIVISIFLLFLLFVFLGIVGALWLSDITGSFVFGFGMTAMAIMVMVIILALARKVLFINPIIRSIIHQSGQPISKQEE